MSKDQEQITITMETVKLIVNSIANIRKILDYTELNLLGLSDGPEKPANVQAKAPPVTSEPVQDAPQSIEGKVERIFINTKNKAGKVFKSPQYAIIINGRKLTTFDTDHHDTAEKARDAGKSVCADYLIVQGSGTTEFYNMTDITMDPN